MDHSSICFLQKHLNQVFKLFHLEVFFMHNRLIQESDEWNNQGVIRLNDLHLFFEMEG